MSRIMQQLGLGYLRTAPQPASSRRVEREEAPPYFDEALLLYSRPILDALGRAPEHRAALFDIVKSTRIPIEDALKVLPELERRGLVTIETRDLVGNHTLSLAPRGIERLGA